MTDARAPASYVVGVAGGLAGLVAGVILWRQVPFSPASTDIVGWTTVHAYSKARELAGFWGAFPAVVGGAVAARLAWRAGGRAAARRLGREPGRVVSWGAVFLILLLAAACETTGLLPASAVIGFAVVMGATGVARPGGQAMATRTPRSGVRVAIALSVALYAFSFLGEGIHRPLLDAYVDGEIAVPWKMVLDGAVPYRDVFINQGLFNNMGKAAIAGFGAVPTIFNLRLLQALLEPTFYVAAFWLGRRIFQSNLTALAAPLLFLGMRINWLDRQTLALVAVTLTLRAVERSDSVPHGRWRAAVLAGMASTAAFLYSTESGLAAFAACGITILVSAATSRDEGAGRVGLLAAYACGAILAFVPLGAYLASNGALGSLVDNTWTQLTYQSAAWGLPFPPLVPSSDSLQATEAAGADALGLVRAYLAPATYLGVALALAWRWREASTPSWLTPCSLLLFGVVLFQVALGRSDDGHVLRGSYFCWFLLLSAAEAWSAPRGRPSAVGSRVLAVGLVGVLALGLEGLYHPARVLAAHTWQLVRGRSIPWPVATAWAPIGGVAIDPEVLHARREVATEIERLLPPDATFFDFSNQPAFYLYTGRRVPTRFALVAYAATRRDQEEVVRALEAESIPVVLGSGPTFFSRIDGISQEQRHPVIADYLRREFRVLKVVNETTILVRRRLRGVSD